MDNHATIESVPKWLLVVAGIILASAVGLRAYRAIVGETPTTTLVVINSASFTTEVADTDEKRERGLGGRDALGPREAMYFPFATANQWVFWMKDMRFPIDIIWIRDGIVVDITKNAPVPTGERLERFSPSAPVNGVLEVNAGVADEINVKPGDSVFFKT